MKMSLICIKKDVRVENIFILNGFARRLALKQRQRVTRKWPIFHREQVLVLYHGGNREREIKEKFEGPLYFLREA